MSLYSKRPAAFIVQNIKREGPGLIADVLEKYSIKYDVCHAGSLTLYPDPSDYSIIFILGGPDSANDDTEKMRRELKFAEDCEVKDAYTFGHCLGLQVLAKAAGAEVSGNIYNNLPLKEVGFFHGDGFSSVPYVVCLTNDGKQSPLFSGINHTFPVFQLHGETAEVPENGVLLAEGRYCRNQTMRIGKNAYGDQYHVEFTRPLLERLLEEDEDLKSKNKDEILEYYGRIEQAYSEIGRRKIENALCIAGLIKRGFQ